VSVTLLAAMSFIEHVGLGDDYNFYADTSVIILDLIAL